jgi:hypothetical protein
MKQFSLAFLLCAIIFTSCSDSNPETKAAGKPAGVVFKRADYGDKWPFTVDEIESYCAGPVKDEIYFRAGDKVYALNGSAQTAAEHKKSTETFETFKAVWLDDPQYPGSKIVVPLEFISKAQEKCGNP